MKTIVIPDIHQKTHLVKEILEQEPSYDEVVFLGDWFDSFESPPIVSSFQETCQFLRSLILESEKRDKFVFLIGNHDLSYIYYNNGKSNEKIPEIDGYYCSGFDETKAKEFRSVFFDKGLKDEFFHKHFKLAHQSQGFVLSHAGIHPSFLKQEERMETLVTEVLPKIWSEFRNHSHPRNTILSGAGYARFGNVPIGGLVWLDWRVEFETNQKTGKQIVGHTHVKEPDVKYLNTKLESWNIDTEKDYGIILNGKFSTKKINNRAVKKKSLASRVLNLSKNQWSE